MILSVIVVSYHTGDILFDCIHSVIENNLFEVIVVNNGNDDTTNQKLSDLSQKETIRLISGQGNIGFASACNLGARAATGSVLLFLNPDLIISQSQLNSLLSMFKTLEPKTLLTPLICNLDGSEQKGCRRNFLTPESLLIEALPFLKIIPFFKRHRLDLVGSKIHSPFEYVDATSGACMMISREFFGDLKGFDEKYFLHVEDLDLCYRIGQQNGRIAVCSDIKVDHEKSTSQVSHVFVEKHKRDGFIYYFKKFYKKYWYSPLGWLLMFAIHAKYFLAKLKKS